MGNSMKWIEDFKREIKTKKAVIISGNVDDIYFDNGQSEYLSIIKTIRNTLSNNQFNSIIAWDQVEGLNASKEDVCKLESNVIANVDSANQKTEDDNTDVYDIEDGDIATESISGNKYQDPEQFFPLLYHGMVNDSKKAFVIDWSSYVFSNPNAMADNQKKWATTLLKAIRDADDNISINGNSKDEITSNIIVFVIQGASGAISTILGGNPMVATINIPKPDRNDRIAFVDKYINHFHFKNEIKNEIEKANFIDLLDGMTLRDLKQLLFLSRSNKELTPQKLVNLYKYGIISSPWEELSKDKISEIKGLLGKRVKGQDNAIEKVETVVKRAYTGLSGLLHSSKQRKPKGTLFFVGPTGVGKTELAKSLAEFLFGDEEACLRFDMSEYNHEHSDQRLVGAPPGYVGYEKGGQLTNAVKEKPFSILLFDEIEKAHGRILDKFLQILEDGRLTDGKGETVSFSDTIIIFTSNIGAASESNGPDKLSMEYSKLKKYFIDKVSHHFAAPDSEGGLGRPELLNRIGNNIIVFDFIQNEEVMVKIADAKLKPLFEGIKEKYKVTVEFENKEKALKAIVAKANKEYGGRGILNILEPKIIDTLSEFIFEEKDMFHPGKKIVITQIKDKALFDIDFE